MVFVLYCLGLLFLFQFFFVFLKISTDSVGCIQPQMRRTARKNSDEDEGKDEKIIMLSLEKLIKFMWPYRTESTSSHQPCMQLLINYNAAKSVSDSFGQWLQFN